MEKRIIMNENLPLVVKETFFVKIKNWFKRLFNIEKNTIQPISEAINEIDLEVEKIKKETFKESLQVETKDRILALQRNLKEKELEISDLTDKELDEMIELYKGQIEEKKNKLKQYRNKMMRNKKGV